MGPARRRNNAIRNRLTQLALRILVGLARLLTWLGRTVGLVLMQLTVRPLRLVSRLTVRLLLPLYRLLFTAKHRTIALRRGSSAQATVLSVLTSRYVVHTAVFLLTVSVAVNNLSARGAGLADVAGDSVLSQVVSATNPEEQDIVERAPARKVAYVSRQNAIAPDDLLEAEIGSVVDAEAAVSADGSALQIPVASSSEVQQRSDVVTYIIQGGDTIGGIANRFGVTQKTILAANKMSNADFIKPGQELLIPPITGVLHKVVKGDTIASIATKYKVEAQEILDFNHLADASAISVDQTIIVPGGEIPELPAERPSLAAPGRPGFVGPIPGPAPAIGGGRLNWPTVGRRINQYFRYGHTGIDAECAYGNPLFAAREGTVSAVVYQRWGYGYHIVINHGGGLQTLYGHASKIFVKPGQRVSRGQTIAMCGSTGRSSGTHVHFETWVSGRKVNPLTYL
ncbi:MAG: peptidoglycan DD-metalloendopeptidase family protein [Candidatus Kerfeldbacteria bacterium]|nr:peptidoglycan DD-metalloendopeptidase family protein [Candidatus Kerfeldbacteria bacterium]